MGTDDLFKKRKAEKAKGGLKKRTTNSRKMGERFLLVCEGQRTEPNYFKRFRLSTAEVVPVGIGKNTIGVVEEAIRLKQEAIREKNPYHQIWCVFDRDDFPEKNFSQALQLAQKHDIRVAYSNQAFEIWYLLHFDLIQTAHSREQYKKMLSDRLGRKYEKNDPKIFDDLESRQQTAIKNAKRLLASYGKHNPYKDNPCTTVHLLVEELLSYK
jgi:hypothetical protein